MSRGDKSLSRATRAAAVRHAKQDTIFSHAGALKWVRFPYFLFRIIESVVIQIPASVGGDSAIGRRG